MNIEQMKLVLKEIIQKTDLTPCVVGHRGVGKTAGIIQVCRELEFTYAPLRLGQMEVGDLVGIPYRIEEEMHWSKPCWWPKDSAAATVVHCDELNRAQQEDTLQAIFQFVEPPMEGLPRSLHDHKLAPHHRVVVTINPPDGSYHVAPLDRALVDRMVMIHVGSDVDCWANYAQKRELHDDVRSFIIGNPTLLSSEPDIPDMNMEPSERSWEMVSILKKRCRFPRELEMEIISGIVGSEAAIAFDRWTSTRDERFITAQQIFDSWQEIKTAAQKQTNDNQAATIHDLVLSLEADSDVSDTAFDNLIEYIFSLPRDLQFSILKSLARLPEIAARLCECQQSDEVISILRQLNTDADTANT